MDQASFCVGSLYGIAAAGIVAYILNQIRFANMKAGRANATLDKFPNAMQSTATPLGVVRDSRSARLSAIVLSLLLALVLAILVASAMFIFQA